MIPRPLGVRVLVKKYEDQTGSGLILPPGALRTTRGVVVATGEDVRYLAVADEILFASDAEGVYEFRHDEEWLYVMAEALVLVILDRHPASV